MLLSDKDRVNRTALFARTLARIGAAVPTRLVFTSGTTISIDLATRGPLERWVQRNSMGRLYPFADQVIVTSAGVADDMAAYTGLAARPDPGGALAGGAGRPCSPPTCRARTTPGSATRRRP